MNIPARDTINVASGNGDASFFRCICNGLDEYVLCWWGCQVREANVKGRCPGIQLAACSVVVE